MFNHHHQSTLLLVLATASGLVVSDTYQYDSSVGTTIPDVDDNYTISLFRNGLAHPNATRSVEFNPFAKISDLINTSSPLYQNWNLQINISDFSVPNAANIAENETDFAWFETTFVDPHIVDYSYGLSWPGGGSLESALPENVSHMCFTTLDMWGTPANVSNLLSQQDADDSTDCSFVLGTECVSAIEDAIRTDPCRGVEEAWTRLDACADTLGYAAAQDYNSKYGTTLTRDLSNNGTDSGDSFWGGWSGAHNGSDTSAYDRITTGLRVMTFSPVVTNGNVNVSGAQVVCTRIDARQVEEQDNSDNDDDTSAGWSIRASSGIATLFTLGWAVAAACAA